MINYYIEGKDDANIIRICEQFRFNIPLIFSDKEPRLWILALDYFVAVSCDETDNTKAANINLKLNQILKEIDDRKVASLIQVIDRLSKTKISLGVVREHFLTVINHEAKLIDDVILHCNFSPINILKHTRLKQKRSKKLSYHFKIQ